jgi:hypothetical protein
MKSRAKKTGFKTGQIVQRSGNYAVFHTPHSLRREVTLLKEHAFPACSRCVLPVRFDLLQAVPAETARERFRLLMHAA